jgi:hypothetical protein
VSDATLPLCDDEPWNQRPAPPPRSATGEPMRSVYHRVMHRIPIFSAPGVHAAFVYAPLGHSVRQEPCIDCGDLGFLTAWQEYQFLDEDRSRDPKGRQYKVESREIDLCEACGHALQGLPLGIRWKRSKERAAVLGRCIRALEAVGYTEAADALRAVQTAKRAAKGAL